MHTQSSECPYNIALSLQSRRESMIENLAKLEAKRAYAAAPITWQSGRAWATPSRQERLEAVAYWEGRVAGDRAAIAWLEAWPGEWFGPQDQPRAAA